MFQAELLTGLSVKTIDDAEKAVLMILERGAGKAVITLGGKGSVIGTQENRMPKHIPVTPAEPVDTTVTYYSYAVHLIIIFWKLILIIKISLLHRSSRSFITWLALRFVLANNLPCRTGLGCVKGG